jgi:hypothetical protein
MVENIVIKELLDKPFALHPIPGKLRTVNKVRPAPLLPMVTTNHKTKAEQYKDIFLPLSMKRLTG